MRLVQRWSQRLHQTHFRITNQRKKEHFTKGADEGKAILRAVYPQNQNRKGQAVRRLHDKMPKEEELKLYLQHNSISDCFFLALD